MTTNIITKTFHTTIDGGVEMTSVPFTFREDGWFHMTKAAKAFGKDLGDFWRSPATKEYIVALTDVLSISGESPELWRSRSGRYGGTWAHPKLAVFFARWLDVTFSVWCDSVISEILKTGMYLAPAVVEEVKEDPEAFLARALVYAQSKLQVVQQENEVLTAEVVELKKRVTLEDYLSGHDIRARAGMPKRLDEEGNKEFCKTMTEISEGLGLPGNQKRLFPGSHQPLRVFHPRAAEAFISMYAFTPSRFTLQQRPTTHAVPTTLRH
ncbi:MAG: KilA-N domain-containing protein [Aquabacterium sp.]